ncbi:MAG: hypothetical protein KU37_11725 [Sulfuricurvum sp. PC08-66]|nr:MAG: hypothetical protein KU37_11725 [Sulfuricurvum sp. PC08-66]
MAKFSEFKNLCVLYAEDDATLRDITAKTLDMVVGTVFAVGSGDEALKIFAAHRIDIVILDIHMGSTSGIEVAKTIRKENDKIPIAIVSGSLATQDLLQACTLNLIEYIQKPIEFNALMKMLHLALDRLIAQGQLSAPIGEGIHYDYFAKAFVDAKSTQTALTKNEIATIELLLRHRGQVVTYETLMRVFDEEMSDGALKNLILRLRKKMGDDSALRNLAKVGYLLQ